MVFKKTPYSLTLKEKNSSGIFRRIVGGTDHLNQIEFPGLEIRSDSDDPFPLLFS